MIYFARIDERLIHGQIATSWAPSIRADLLLVVDDKTATDEFEKMITLAVAPVSCKTEVLTINQAIERLSGTEGSDPNLKIFLLFKGPSAPLALVKAGVKINELNMGNIFQSANRKPFYSSCFLSEEEKQELRDIISSGTKVYYRLYPKDKNVDISTML